MYKLLNRFAWILSIIFGLNIIFIFGGGHLFYFLGDFIILIIFIVITLIIKKILFSEKFIKERLEFFAKALEGKFLENKSTNNTVEKLKNEDSKYKSIELKTKIENKLEKIGFGAKSLKEIDPNATLNTFEENKIGINDLPDEGFLELPKNIKKKKEKKIYEPNAFEIYLGKFSNYIKEFFSTNILAKLGGILLLLTVVYFLKGIALNFWDTIGVVGRISIGIIIGFLVYFIGTKLHKKYSGEGLTLMGTGILINYAVILSGRYLAPDTDFITTELVVSIFLILNTIFGVITSLVYKSKILLIFSFLFAYAIPFIIAAKNQGEPYSLLFYSFIISIGGLFLANKQKNIILLIISFILGNLLFFVAPFSNSIGWSVKIIFTTVLSLISIIISKGLKPSVDKLVLILFIGTYIFIILNLINSGNFLSQTISFFVYNIIIIGLFSFSIYFLKNFVKQENSPIQILFVIPFIIILFILFSGNLIFSPFVLIFSLILFLVGFSQIEQNFSDIYKNILFGAIAVFIFLFSYKINLSPNLESNNLIEFLTILISSFIFLFFSYYYSRKKDLSTLFSVGTIGTILILVPILVVNFIWIKSNSTPINLVFYFLSIFAIIIFGISNIVLPFINKQLFEKKNLYNLVIGSVAGVLFLAFQIYNYGEIHFPGIVEGFAFLSLAIIYFMQAYFITKKLGIENIKKDENMKNIFYTFSGISISLFSVSMAFVFSDYPEIITTIWLFEATILYYIFSKNFSKKIFFAATILFLIGLTRFGILIHIVEKGDFMFLVSFTIIFASFILNLFFIDKEKNIFSIKEFSSLKNIHYVLHIIGMAIMGALIVKIIPSTGHGWSILGISSFIIFLGFFYAKLNSIFLKYVFIVLIILFSIFHIGNINYIFYKLGKDNLEYLKFLQYFVTTIFIFNIFIWKKFNNHLSSSKLSLKKDNNINNNENKINLIIKIIILIYAFLISNIYILDVFSNSLKHFSLTLYWGLITSILLIYGIQKNLTKFRTIGLYFLVLTIAKIFIYDVWEVGDITSRYVIFGTLGVILIIISTLYTKKYGDNLLGEFHFNNLKNKKKGTKNINPNSTQKNEKEINKKIKKIDVSNYKWVIFKDSNGKKTRMRSKKLMQIIKLILDNVKKDNFEAGELQNIYKKIKENYHSDLEKEKYEEYINILEDFIKKGGTIKFEKKE